MIKVTPASPLVRPAFKYKILTVEKFDLNDINLLRNIPHKCACLYVNLCESVSHT